MPWFNVYVVNIMTVQYSFYNYHDWFLSNVASLFYLLLFKQLEWQLNWGKLTKFYPLLMTFCRALHCRRQVYTPHCKVFFFLYRCIATARVSPGKWFINLSISFYLPYWMAPSLGFSYFQYKLARSWTERLCYPLVTSVMR